LPLRLFRSFRRRDEAGPASAGGRSLYAIGDVHGRLDLLDPLIDQIRQDALVEDGRAKPVLIFVGDYVDRGASSKGVIDRVIALEREGAFELRALKGNHEEALLAFLDDANFGPTWCENGGAQTLSSYGVTPPKLRIAADEWGKARDAFAQALPPEHLDLLVRLELTAVYGDYVFVHAGLRPGVPLNAQRERDLLWIRNDFLNAPGPFDKIVVHGHTPAEEAFMGAHRIGIDTGAYATGVLTAVRLRDGDRRFIQSTAAHRR
jgi:serine/threonine protein phosphatase 1